MRLRRRSPDPLWRKAWTRWWKTVYLIESKWSDLCSLSGFLFWVLIKFCGDQKISNVSAFLFIPKRYYLHLPIHPGFQSQMKVFSGFPTENGDCHPGGEWHPGWGVDPNPPARIERCWSLRVKRMTRAVIFQPSEMFTKRWDLSTSKKKKWSIKFCQNLLVITWDLRVILHEMWQGVPDVVFFCSHLWWLLLHGFIFLPFPQLTQKRTSHLVGGHYPTRSWTLLEEKGWELQEFHRQVCGYLVPNLVMCARV